MNRRWTRHAVGIIAAAFAPVMIVATPQTHAQMKGRLLEDDAHRFHVELTVAQQSVVVGDVVPTIFCLSPAVEDVVEVCLGAHRGHWFFAGDHSTSVFTLRPDGDSMCRCERPVVLRADRPLCWSMDANVSEISVGSSKIGGFVTVLEGVHEIGGTADSCTIVNSQHVPLTVRPKSDDTKPPPKKLPRGLHS
jgi:hypothetical protein